MRTARIAATGHPAVTARHDKTLELTAADAITERATCILAVSAAPLPGDLPLLRGRVRLTITAGGQHADVDGEVNPGWHSDRSLIVRRSDHLDPDTYLVNAGAAAGDLPAALVAALREPAPVEVTVTELAPPTPVVLVLTGGPVTAEIERLAAQADLVVDLTGRGAPPPPVALSAPRVHRIPDRVEARTIVVLAEHAGAAVALTRGNRVVLWPPRAGADLLLSAGYPPEPLLQVGPVPPGPELARLLTTPAAAVVDLPPGADPHELAPDHTVLAPAAELGWGVRAGGTAGSRVVLLPPPGDRVALDPAELARLLRAAGSSGRDAAAALTALGVPRRLAYRLAADPDGGPR
jgi:hypothetical protein